MGQVIEVRLLWKKLREDAAPQLCGRKADSEEHAKELLQDLVAGGDGHLVINPEVVTGAKACPNCRPIAASRGLASVATQDLGHLSKQGGRDWKMAQAGER